MSAKGVKKYESGYEKRKRKKRLEELTQSQRGALDKFFVKNCNNSTEGDNISDNIGNNIDCTNFVDDMPVDNDCDHEMPPVDENNFNVLIANEYNGDVPLDNHDVIPNVDVPIANDYENILHDVLSDDNVADDDDVNVCKETFKFDIFDPRNWDALDSKMIDIVVVKGLKRDMSINQGPRDKNNKFFSSAAYNRVLPNGEKYERDWLVYSKELDRAFCFCCKVFSKVNIKRGKLAMEGFDDWIHLSGRLKEHEKSAEHIRNMGTWYDLRWRLQNNKTIDNINQVRIKKDRDHWCEVLLRIMAVVKFLAKNNLAFPGDNARLYQGRNGNFLGLIEMLVEFDPIIREHVRRITSDEIHAHYLGPSIQNELIVLLASRVKSEIIRTIKQAKYFTVILDCTPDTSHEEQMSIILRYVNVSSKSASIEESFLGFLKVNDTTGQGLFDFLKDELKSMDLNMDDVRGQGYDNGSNMKGKHQGVQKRMLDVNPRAFYMPCGCHSLNLMLCDMANSCGKARDFFGIIQRIYTIFANSTKRWHILKDNVKGLTLKSLSATRWESRIESVKAIRFQMDDIREALFEVAEKDSDSKIRSEAKSLALNELGDFEFIVSIIVWFEMLYHVNLVSKNLQSKDMLIDVAIQEIKALITVFEQYRECGFDNAIEEAKKVALEMNISPEFPQRRQIRRKKHFDENQNDSSEVDNQSAKELFRVNCFLFIVDQAIASLKWRFEKYQEFENIFGFLFTSEKLNSMDDAQLKLRP